MPDARPRNRRALVVAVVVAVLVLAASILIARWWRDSTTGAAFIAEFPGSVAPPPGTPEGFPAWLSWTHFLNGFFLLFIVSSALHLRSKARPIAFVTRRNRLPRTANPPKRLGLHTWWHLVVVALWIATGLVYVALLLVTGHWARIVPTEWSVVPNAISAGVQYLSLNWPAHTSWAYYNSLQVLFYGATVFVAAPLALATGLRLSPVWPEKWMRTRGALSDAWARQTHSLVLWFYLAFTVVHVGLVLLTGARRNLNAMYLGIDDGESWLGAIVFGVSVVVMALAWVLLRPPAQVAIAERVADVRRMPAAPATEKPR
ncbi:cytochrome b/b6 domain-containing protein [Microcella sp.]|uniref:cytochrome b/b6 domain-containing protein n=1 Tax=Microcella sp. TaxID=1913979 RepID=UPI002569E05D|nr:cytochrome b/b6 domain-containing protein [Microcella sp.]MBX9471362.1 cytochrome b/b6 domain-containing protein [Microcella sp.]